jgi:parallel beta-helix repeat protein
MKKAITFFAVLIVLSVLSGYSQTYMDLEDNMDISSNSWIIINPGNYTIPDVGNDGLIRINDKENIIIDGTNVNVDGVDYTGYMIKINNSNNIVIKNFESVSHFYYAVYITNSDSIIINDCNYSWNKVDSTGWISIWTNYQSALGGGVMMYQTNYAEIYNNDMKYQNDGVALYHCDSINIWDNDFSWNTSFGIRMYFTDYCHIHHNNCSHVNRPFTNPSDCAALLVLVSNENLVEHNDLSYSGDGVFLGQYQYSYIPNNNIFQYNECSYSPHNAIEATFADGNIFRHNNCNYSHYGMWLGYLFNSLVDSNEVIGNQHSGIAIDRGFNNTITGNDISENPVGIELWEGDNIPGYEDQYSFDYFIRDNIIEGNRLAVQAQNTEHLIVEGNEFLYNNNGILLEEESFDDTISSNLFYNTTFYHIENQSTYDIFAQNNTFFSPDEDFIECNIYDKTDDPAKGEVIWQPFSYGNTPVIKDELVDDMAEEPALWYAYPEICWWHDSSLATNVQWDYSDKIVGEASVFCETGNGWDIGLHYWPTGDTLISWSIKEEDTLKFWLKTTNNTVYGFQFHHIRVGNNCGGYFKYTGPSSVLNNAIGNWIQVNVPLAGGGVPSYSRTQYGNVSFDDISYVSIHADTWDVGFEIWVDGVHFTSVSTDIEEYAEKGLIYITNYPNPFTEYTTISYYLPANDHVRLTVFDISGRKVRILKDEQTSPGYHEIRLMSRDLPKGICFYSIQTSRQIITNKMAVISD